MKTLSQRELETEVVVNVVGKTCLGYPLPDNGTILCSNRIYPGHPTFDEGRCNGCHRNALRATKVVV